MFQGVAHICMVDDDPDSYYLFETALREINDSVRITYCDSCNSLVEFLKSSDDLPDIIVLDMKLPGNTNKCLYLIKEEERFRHVPVIVYPGADTAAGIGKAKPKPSSIRVMKEFIKEKLAIPAISARNR